MLAGSVTLQWCQALTFLTPTCALAAISSKSLLAAYLNANAGEKLCHITMNKKEKMYELKKIKNGIAVKYFSTSWFIV